MTRAIYCAGEQGKVTLDIIRATDGGGDVVFVDDDESLHGESVGGITIVGNLDALEQIDQPVRCIVAFGDRSGIRLELAEAVECAGLSFFSAVHPDATVSEGAVLGKGITVNAQTYLGPDASLGDHVLIDSCVNVSHDVRLGNGATLTPNVALAGGVEVGVDAYVGPGATILEDITVDRGAVVGAGAVVTEDVPPNSTVVGVPATPLKE